MTDMYDPPKAFDGKLDPYPHEELGVKVCCMLVYLASAIFKVPSQVLTQIFRFLGPLTLVDDTAAATTTTSEDVLWILSNTFKPTSNVHENVKWRRKPSSCYEKR